MHIHIHAYIHTYIHQVIATRSLVSNTTMPTAKQMRLPNPDGPQRIYPRQNFTGKLRQIKLKKGPFSWYESVALRCPEMTIMRTQEEVCVCLCVYICVHIYIYTRVWHADAQRWPLWRRKRRYVYVCVCIYVFIYTYIRECGTQMPRDDHYEDARGGMCMFLCVCVYIYIYIYVCMYVCTCVCVYVHTYIHINIHIHTYTHIYFATLLEPWSRLFESALYGMQAWTDRRRPLFCSSINKTTLWYRPIHLYTHRLGTNSWTDRRRLLNWSCIKKTFAHTFIRALFWHTYVDTQMLTLVSRPRDRFWLCVCIRTVWAQIHFSDVDYWTGAVSSSQIHFPLSNYWAAAILSHKIHFSDIDYWTSAAAIPWHCLCYALKRALFMDIHTFFLF
jgi:hypothetical protein